MVTFSPSRLVYGRFGKIVQKAESVLPKIAVKTRRIFDLPAYLPMRDKVQRHQVRMTAESSVMNEYIECPLCCGTGELTRAEILDRLGVKDFARVAQSSAEEAFRLLQSKHDREHQSARSRFETELAKRTTEIREHHKDELRLAQSDRDDLTRRALRLCLREVAALRVAEPGTQRRNVLGRLRGKLEEISFEEEARAWAGIVVSEKLPRTRRIHLGFPRIPAPLRSSLCILVDNKDKEECQGERHQELDP